MREVPLQVETETRGKAGSGRSAVQPSGTRRDSTGTSRWHRGHWGARGFEPERGEPTLPVGSLAEVFPPSYLCPLLICLIPLAARAPLWPQVTRSGLCLFRAPCPHQLAGRHWEGVSRTLPPCSPSATMPLFCRRGAQLERDLEGKVLPAPGPWSDPGGGTVLPSPSGARLQALTILELVLRA